jgi:hypothetical protein
LERRGDRSLKEEQNEEQERLTATFARSEVSCSESTPTSAVTEWRDGQSENETHSERVIARPDANSAW